MNSDLDELKRLHRAATPGPWMTDMLFNIVDDHGIIVHNFEEYGHTSNPSKANVRYIVAACNAVPELIARVRELERQRKLLAAKVREVAHETDIMGSCDICEFRGYCDDSITFCGDAVIRWAEETAKEAGKN